MSELDSLLPDFIEETRETLERVNRDLAGILEAGDRAARIDSIFRGVHTIKGGAGLFGLDRLQKVAHALESKLALIKSDPSALDETKVSAIQRVVDRFESLLPVAGAAPAAAAAPDTAAPAAPASHAATERPAAEAAPVRGPEQLQREYIRVPVERIQRNFEIISEIFLIRNQLSHLVLETDWGSVNPEFLRQWEVLDNSLRQRIGELENIALGMRMMPVKGLFDRMEKTVRAYCSDTGKRIRFETSGELTELDKKVVDSMADPLIHLVRNAMDHGIEAPEDRAAAGKPEHGLIRLEARLAGNEVRISLSDDGRGMDPERIRAAAIRKGMDVSRAQTRDEILQLIFEPGFSTAEAVTDVSGRGVGMDAVRTYISDLGGALDLHTEIGSGTVFTLRVPIGMSVIPAVIAAINGEKYAVSTHDVIETLTVDASAIGRSGSESYVSHEGKFIPFIHAADALGTRERDGLTLFRRKIPVCVAMWAGRKVAIGVDELRSNTEIVAKPMPKMSPAFPYVTGVSILGNGEPVFVLSLSRLYEALQGGNRVAA